MEAKRIFRETDGDMFAKVNLMRTFFGKNISTFTAYDSQFNNTYLNNWVAAFHEAGMAEADADATGDDGILIAATNEVLERCRAKYRDVKYYAGKAFPNNKEALKEFGEGQFSKVGTSRLRMVQFMETLHGVADKYKTELLAQNFTQPAIDAIAALAQELRDDNKVQQLKKKERPTQTRKRIEAMNRYYGFGQQVAKAARAIYPKRKDLPSAFRLMQRHQKPVTTIWLNLGVGAVRKIALPKALKKFTLALTNLSATHVNYWYADTISQQPEHKFSMAAGEVISILPDAPVKKFLLLQNTAAKPIRLVLKKEAKKKG